MSSNYPEKKRPDTLKSFREAAARAGYETISQAPKRGASLAEEREKRYLSYDAESGACYLIQNPAVWEWRDMESNGNTYKARVRPAPIYVGTINQLVITSYAQKGAIEPKQRELEELFS